MVLVITGHQRSGTTLLMRLCNSHPKMMVTGEFGNFYLLNEPYPVYRRFILQRWWQKKNASFLYSQKRSLKGVNMMQNLVFVLQYLQKIARYRQEPIGVPEIEAALKNMYPYARIVGDKYPDYVFRLKKLTAGETLRCLFIYRDPRDVASSSVKRARTDWQKSWPEELRQPENIARRWVQFIEMMESCNGQILPVCYERLVTQPQDALGEIGEWLDVDPVQFRHEIVQVTSVGKHSQGLSEQEISAVLAIAGPTMQRLGYTF